MTNVFSFAQAHRHAVDSGAGPDEGLGAGVAADFSTREPDLSDGEIVVGVAGSGSLVTLTHLGLQCVSSVPDHLHDSAERRCAEEIIAEWTPRTTATRFAEAKAAELSPEEREAVTVSAYGWAGGWGGHCVLGYDDVLRRGIGGIKRTVGERPAALERAGVSDVHTDSGRAADWYRGLLRVCDGMSAFIRNHAAAAASAAPARTDASAVAGAANAASAASVCSRVAESGARSFHEAVQLFWFIHILDETDSPGRIDQFLYPYYLTLSPDPDERYRRAWPILESLWRKFIAHRSWNVCLGGQDAHGRDAVNELTWLFLDLHERYNREAPNLSVRFHEGSPPELLERCTAVIGRGSGQPALYNDDVVISALVDLGIPVEHARNYAMNGCAQIDIQGMSHMGLEDGEISLAKCLELALHGGACGQTGRRIGARTPDVARMSSFDELLGALHTQIEYAVDLFTRTSNIFQKVQADFAPHLLRSLFVDSCVDRGLDLKRGGPVYNHGQFQTEGIANCGDALYAIKRIVFDEARMPLTELVRVLDSDWRGHEQLRAEIAERFPTYGNGVDDVDALTAGALDHYFRCLNTKRTYRGGRYSGGVVVFNRALKYGAGLAAGADGRRSGDPVADSVGPAQGRDRSGPTAMLRSVSRLPMRKATCGVCLNLKLTPSLFARAEERAAVATMLSTYFRLGGQQLQVNVVDRDTLIAAQAEPHKYENLVVRVGGYSARFVTLSKEQQDDIINRTDHSL